MTRDGRAFGRPRTKFTLTVTGKAQISNIVADPTTGSTCLDTAMATLEA